MKKIKKILQLYHYELQCDCGGIMKNDGFPLDNSPTEYKCTACGKVESSREHLHGIKHDVVCYFVEGGNTGGKPSHFRAIRDINCASCKHAWIRYMPRDLKCRLHDFTLGGQDNVFQFVCDDYEK
jgi:hypothetical protein